MENISLHSIEKRFSVYYKKREYFVTVIEDYVYGVTDYEVSTSTMINGSFNLSEEEKNEVLNYFNKNREE